MIKILGLFISLLALTGCSVDSGGGGGGGGSGGGGSTAPGPTSEGFLLRQNSVQLDSGYLEPFEGVITNSGYGLFGTISRPAQIIKVRLSDFTLQGHIDLNPDEMEIKSAVIDHTNGFAYFGLNTYPGKIIKIRLSDFTRVGELTLANSQEGGLRSAVIDSVRGMIYFGTQTFPGKIIRVRLSTFTQVDTLLLNDDEGDIHSLNLSPASGLLYAATGNVTQDNSGGPAKLVKIDVSNIALMSRLNALTLNSDERVLGAGFIDNNTNSGYFGTRNNSNTFGVYPEFIIKINLNTMTRVSRINLAPGEGYVRAAQFENGFDSAYFTLTMTPGRIVKVRLSDFTRQSSLNFTSGFDRPRFSVIDTANRRLYVGFNTVPVRLARINLSTFTHDASLNAPWGENVAVAMVSDSQNGKIFVGAGNLPGVVVKLNSDTLAREGVLSLDFLSEDGIRSSAVDGANQIAYFGVNGINGFNDKIIKVDTSTMTLLSSMSLSADEKAGALLVDRVGGYLYAGLASPYQGSGSTIRGKITKIRLSDFTRVATITLSGWEEAHPDWGYLHQASGYLYFNSLGTIIKIRLSDFSRVSAELIVSNLGFGALDPSGNFLYFAAAHRDGPPNPSFIYKVRTSDLSVDSVLALGPSEYNIRQVSLDTTFNRLYAVVSQRPGSRIVRVNPATMTRIESIVLPGGDEWAWTGDIDQSRHSLYFGTNTSPAQVVKVQISPTQ